MMRNTIEDMRAAANHQLKRVPDGTSEIDPAREERNEILLGSGDIIKDIQKYEKSIEVRGHKRDTVAPYLTLVLSASPEFFRPDGGLPGSEVDTEEKAARLKAWKAETLKWAKETFGADLVSAIYNGDETTPHVHFGIVPTYRRKATIKPRRLKDEEPEDHLARVEDWDLNGPTINTRSWASNPVVGQKGSSDILRRSYADAMAPLGLHYALASYEPSNPDTPATHREFRDAERAKTLEDREEAKRARDEAQRVRDEAEKRNLRSAAVMEAITALAVEVEQDTIKYSENGKIDVQDSKTIKGGLPDIAQPLKKIARAATDLQTERAQVAKDRDHLIAETARLAEKEAKLTAGLSMVANQLERLKNAFGGVNALARRYGLLKDPQFKKDADLVRQAFDEAIKPTAENPSTPTEKPREESSGLGF